ncbi:lipid A biosynthesis lauroyl acyltransferase [Pollutimonas subterranea]|uniref:Lipid A biosynthesis lauroyl acyltransferase n=1 Tax=Pollutimonas subterranea TaxID=2045210 RepID=A0A2N4U0C7_9BURK|nr:lipid A biosynthesis lauroyl acyltransferase [Pollutimonas subterranea]PLC48464.1 lipid A biosynthesis lauroyl acyltransferase [Pollutimonas subterranea]
MKNRIQNTFTSSLLRGLSALPYELVARTGEGLGSLLYLIPGKRKHILHTNLRLCFPEQNDSQREQLARSTFRHVIRSYLERGVQWYGSAKVLSKLVTLESAIELKDNYEQPTIFLGFHFAAIEAGCMYYSTLHPVASIYTPMSDQATDTISREQRGRFGTEMIPRNGSAREILKVLKSGKPIMLAADMDFGLRDSVFVPFFGVQACTLTAVSRLARLAGARVVPFITGVSPGYLGYKLNIFKALDNFPCGDPAEDALRMNQFLEEQVRLTPEQYYWVHRRFKRRPAGEAAVY